jgi:hypothetical protein
MREEALRDGKGSKMVGDIPPLMRIDQRDAAEKQSNDEV